MPGPLKQTKWGIWSPGIGRRALCGLNVQVVIYDDTLSLRSSCPVNLTAFNNMPGVYKCKHKWKDRKS